MSKETLDGGNVKDIEDNDIIMAVAIEFGSSMGKILAAKDKGLAWRGETTEWLLMRLKQETEELEYAMNHGSKFAVCEECIDVAAYAMFIRDRVGR